MRALPAYIRTWRDRWRKLVTPKLDLPFGRDDFNRVLPWLLAVLVFLAGIVIALALSLRGTAHEWRSRSSDLISIQLPAGLTEPKVEKLVRMVEAAPGIGDVRQVPEEEVAKLVEPWLGDIDAGVLPLPVLIDARIADRDTADVEALTKDLLKAAPGARVQGHEAWAQAFGRFLAGLQQTAYALAGLIVGAAMAMVALAARTGMQLHRDTVELLHLMGARDGYIARQFQRNLRALTLKGASAGAGAAAGVFLLATLASANLPSLSVPHLVFSGAHVLMFVVLAVAFVLLAQGVARMTALRLLRNMF